MRTSAEERGMPGFVYGGTVAAGTIHGGVSITTYESGPWAQRPVPPRQVPVGIPSGDFVNQRRALGAMKRWLRARPDGVRVVALSGMPGVGKSELVCQWVNAADERFPGGQLYVDFADTRRSAQGADVSGVLRGWLLAYQVNPAFLADGVAELAAFFRGVTEKLGPTLVVAENVTQAAQVRHLMPGAPGSVVVVVSRYRLDELTPGGERLVALEELDSESGVRLLGRLCGRTRVRGEREAAERLVALCGGLPLALRVIAARLARHTWLTLAELADELTDERARLAGLSVGGEDVTAMLNVGTEGLPDDQARLYRRLGLSPTARIDAATAAAAGDIPEAEARRLLAELRAASLLSAEDDGRHYRLHELLRLHARQRAEEEEGEAERAAVLRRVVDRWLKRVAVADLLVMGEKRLRIRDHTLRLAEEMAGEFGEGEAGKAAALAWLVDERGDALAVLRAAVEAGLHRPAWQLAEALTALFLKRRYVGDWRECCERGAEAAARDGEDGDPAAEARLLCLLSRPLMDLERYDEAREVLERARTRAEASGHGVLRASVQEFLGRYWDHADPRRAIEAYRLSYELNLAAREPRGAAIARYFLGCSLDASGDHEAALNLLREAREALLECGDPRMAGRARLAMGVVHGGLGQVDQARAALAEAAETLRAQESTHYEAQALEALAGLDERAGDGEAFREHLGRAVDIYEEGGSPRAVELLRRLEAGPTG